MNICRRCRQHLQKVQQKYNERYYLGHRCPRCRSTFFDMPIQYQTSPWEDVNEVNDIKLRQMKDVERVSGQ